MLDRRSRVAGVAAGPSGPGGRLLDPDLHPENVILTGEGPKIIDWESAAQSPAEAAVALCRTAMRISEIPGPPLRRRVGAAGRAPASGARW